MQKNFTSFLSVKKKNVFAVHHKAAAKDARALERSSWYAFTIFSGWMGGKKYSGNERSVIITMIIYHMREIWPLQPPASRTITVKKIHSKGKRGGERNVIKDRA
ncbi:hypothetical protein [Nitrososphaera viennensis]|uniref:Uncharacterized protein n=2 Tax=Nitrososphaera viennensis TaxID=1034015 RepID=A0A060HT30_9ARCH|nr:hypothetical protein [Nitrososphaera viennensis]AIC16307.1 hypothetical protein NVIE_020480 [Nitrososphaera viennensis EN76]UVS68244.1 hypothetical protein NWT39_10075 [Nitrososphaera viennensis]